MLEKGKCYLKEGNVLYCVEKEIADLVKPHLGKYSTSKLLEWAVKFKADGVSYEHIFCSVPFATINFGGEDCLSQTVFSESSLKHHLENKPSWSKPTVQYH